MSTLVGRDQGGMVELVLDQDIQIGGQLEVQIVGQVCGVISPGNGNDPDRIAAPAQVFDEFAVI